MCVCVCVCVCVQGNSHLSAGAYDVAVECYTKGMELDPTNALLPANRALAFIKLNKSVSLHALLLWCQSYLF